jgi:hypothetical protein
MTGRSPGPRIVRDDKLRRGEKPAERKRKPVGVPADDRAPSAAGALYAGLSHERITQQVFGTTRNRVS